MLAVQVPEACVPAAPGCVAAVVTAGVGSGVAVEAGVVVIRAGGVLVPEVQPAAITRTMTAAHRITG
jgi:hypothetical protein